MTSHDAMIAQMDAEQDALEAEKAADLARLDALSSEIKAWDKRDISDLADMLKEVDQLCAAHEQDTQTYYDASELPTANIPDDVDTGYPIWAMDRSGDMLTGWDHRQSGHESITLDEYRSR